MKGFSIALLITLVALPAAAQVFTVTPEGVDAKYLQFEPTHIEISSLPLTHHDREELLRFLQAEQGFTMRPLPIAALTLHANGKMKPEGVDYVNLIQKKGIAAEAGKRVVITNVDIEKDRIILDFNGGPVHKHRWLRHISVGTDPYYTQPIVHDAPNEATGSRIVLVFAHDVPDLTGLQVEALVKPIVDFNVKTPQQAYTDTLPPFLRKAVMSHRVLVGMNHEMVLSAMGEPWKKMRESVDNQDVEIWIYGKPPDPTQFVRFYGNRVIRLEIARVDEPIEVHAKNEMGDYWNTQLPENARIVKLGDQNPANSKDSAPAAAPSLRLPGETLPVDKNKSTPQMQPVEYPKDTGGAQTSSGSQQGNTPASTPQSQPQPATTQPPPSLNPNQQLVTTALLH
jgi:hypothetical protein